MRENLVWDICAFVTCKAGLYKGSLSKGVPLYSQRGIFGLLLNTIQFPSVLL